MRFDGHVIGIWRTEEDEGLTVEQRRFTRKHWCKNNLADQGELCLINGKTLPFDVVDGFCHLCARVELKPV